MTDTPDNEALLREAVHTADYARGLTLSARDLVRRLAAALQAASRAPQSVPEGWCLAPVEPSDHMNYKGWVGHAVSGQEVNAIYRAMLSARPTPPTLDAGEDQQ